MGKNKREDRVDTTIAAKLLDELWASVTQEAEQSPGTQFVEDAALRQAIHASVNHPQVSYRFCLPIQLLGKFASPAIDCLALQRGKGKNDDATWDARSLGSKVFAPFNSRQENVLGTSNDPYVGNAMRIPRMKRDDTSKRDIAGWNILVGVLESVQRRSDPVFTEAVIKQVLLEIHKRQLQLRFTYPVPPRVSLRATIDVAMQFLAEKSGGDRAQALAGALFDVIGIHFKLFSKVNRARINASDEASGQVADLECVNEENTVVIAVEVKDRALKLADVEGTITKTRNRDIRNIFFTAPRMEKTEADQITTRIQSAFAGGQNLYVVDFFDLARAVLSLGGEEIRVLFLRKVGDHLDNWNTQPSHRQAWKRLLESI
jgi:hypothetical protein